MTKHASIQLPKKTYERLERIAERTGDTPLSHVRKAIEAYLEDIEDIEMAEQALDSLKRGETRTYTLDEVEAELGLEH